MKCLNNMKFLNKTHHIFPLLLVLTGAIGAYFVWRVNTPYLFPTNWDIWEHQTIINMIKNGNIALYPSQLSDTFRFDGYTTIFHIILAVIQRMTGTNSLGFWWIAEAIFTIATAVATYAFVYILTRKPLSALIAGVLSSFFFESTVVFTPLFLMPQTASALLWVIGLTILLSHMHTDRKIIILIPLMLGMVFIHMIIGLVGLGVYGLILLFNRIKLLKKPVWFSIFLVGLPVVLFGMSEIVIQMIPLGQINFGEASAYMQNPLEKLFVARTWYGFLPIVFLPLGLITTKKRSLAIAFVVLLTLTCSRIPYALKFYTLARFLTIAFMASGIVWLLSFIRTVWLRWMSLGFVAIAVIAIFVTNISAWKASIEFRGIASQVSSDELSASEFLVDAKKNDSTYLISDPATQYIFEALTGINSQGGAYMNESSRKTLVSLFASKSADEFKKQVFTVKDTLTPINHETILLIVSARTLKWLDEPSESQLSLTFNVWRPEGLTLHDRMKIDAWEKTYDLTKTFENNALVIYEIDRKDIL